MRIEGIVTALVTPFNLEGELDENALERIVEFQIAKGVHGLYPCATFGEGPIMTLEQRKRVAETVIQKTRRRIPVVVQVGASDASTTIELARHAEHAGADAIAVVTPYYYNPDEKALVEYYRQVSEDVSIPIFIYNIPYRTTVNITPDIALKIVAAAPRVRGIKDSSRDFMQVLEYIERFPRDFMILNGADPYILPALIMGAAGAMSAYSNAFPELYVSLYDLFKKGDYDKAREVQFRINLTRRILRLHAQPFIQPVKEAMKMRGIPGGFVKRPLRPMTEQEIDDLRSRLKKLDLL
jgi:4-hydroxy-tetrahydrodipicolinate synthase